MKLRSPARFARVSRQSVGPEPALDLSTLAGRKVVHEGSKKGAPLPPERPEARATSCEFLRLWCADFWSPLI